MCQFEAMQENADSIKLRLQQNAVACRAALDEQYNLIFDDHLFKAIPAIATRARTASKELPNR